MRGGLTVHVNPTAHARRASSARLAARTVLRAVSGWVRSAWLTAFPPGPAGPPEPHPPSPLAKPAALREPAVLSERIDARATRHVA